MDWYKVTEVSKILKVNHTTIYRKIKKMKKSLKGETKRTNGTLFLSEKAIETLEKTLTQKSEIHNKSKQSKENLCNDMGTHMAAQMCAQQNAKEEQYQNIIDREMNCKDEALKRKDEIIQELIKNHAQERERTDTIIMKLTQDLEQTRKLIENKMSTEKKEKTTKSEPGKTDRVISIQEFINTKLEEDIQRSKFEEEQRRLKKQYSNPLNGKSALYKLYIKMFRPDMLREAR